MSKKNQTENIEEEDDNDNYFISNSKIKKNAFNGLLIDSDTESDISNDSNNSNNSDKCVKSNENINNKGNEKSKEIVKNIENEKSKKDNKYNSNKNIIIEDIKKDKNNKIKQEKNNRNDIDIGKSNIFTENIELIIGGKILINESNVVINTNTKYVILGNNGVGKSSLIKYIYEKLKDKEDILMIDQHVKIEKNETVNDFILKANNEMYNKQIEFKNLGEKEELNDEEIRLYEELSEYLNINEWEKFNSNAKKILNGLGFNDINIYTNELSGGWQIRLALGRALLRNPKILILDEPTNNLDINANIWLTHYLETYKNTLIVVTHEIDLINSISNIIWFIGDLELKGNMIYTIRGNYNNVQKQKIIINKEMEKNYEKFQNKIKEMRNKSTLKKDVDKYIKNNNVPRPPKEYKVNIEFDNVSSLNNNKIIQFNDVKFSYNGKLIFEKLNLTIDESSRIILVGPNGVGKSTFFKLCSGLVNPNNGYIIKDDRLRVGYFNQNVADSIIDDLTPIEYLQTLDGQLKEEECRKILGKLGIKKTESNYDLPKTKNKYLSGGQKSRVSIASSVQLKKPHLIMLDEISNHLDIESIEGLIKGINECNSAFVLITHDMYLIRNIKNSTIYEVKDNNIVKFNGDFNDYIDKISVNF
jgi:ATPase subunit of ABC transporter with duplicated ATPase domains